MPDKMSPKTGMLNAPATSTRSTSSASVRVSRLHRQPRCKYPCTNPQQTKLNQKNGKPNYAVATPHTSATATPWRSHQNLGVCAPGKLSAKKSSSIVGCLSHRHASELCDGSSAFTTRRPSTASPVHQTQSGMNPNGPRRAGLDRRRFDPTQGQRTRMRVAAPLSVTGRVWLHHSSQLPRT